MNFAYYKSHLSTPALVDEFEKMVCIKPKMTYLPHARIQKVLSEGSNFDNVFFFILMRGG